MTFNLVPYYFLRLFLLIFLFWTECSVMCTSNDMDHRTQQCHSYNGRHIMGYTVTDWIPNKKVINPCELSCYSTRHRMPYSFGKVHDGTPCHKTQVKVCLNGRCTAMNDHRTFDETVGCDNITGSTAKRDHCGVCNGKGNTCRRVKNVFNLTRARLKGKSLKVVKVPKGSTSIKFRGHGINHLVLSDNNNTLAVRKEQEDKAFEVAGAIFWYSHEPAGGTEWLQADGPTLGDVQVKFSNGNFYPRIIYEFWIPNRNDTRPTVRGPDAIKRRHSVDTTTTVSPVIIHSTLSALYQPTWKPTKNEVNSVPNPPAGKRTVYKIPKPYKKKSNLKKNKDIDCPPCRKSAYTQQQFCDSEFVLRVLVLNSERINTEIRYELQVIRSFRNVVPIQPREFLWVPERCRCPKLRNGREYIIVGRTDKNYVKREVRLVVDPESYARRFSDNRALKVLHLRSKAQRLCDANGKKIS